MTLDEAINTLEHGIEQLTMELKSGLWEVGSDTENAIKEGIKDNEQLIAWLIESKEAKRLLKAAVEDIHDVLSSQIKITNYTLCEKCKHYLNCNCKDKCIARYDLKQWRFADEALKLIGED